MVWGDHIKSFSTLFYSMLNYCTKFQNVKFKIFLNSIRSLCTTNAFITMLVLSMIYTLGRSSLIRNRRSHCYTLVPIYSEQELGTFRCFEDYCLMWIKLIHCWRDKPTWLAKTNNHFATLLSMSTKRQYLTTQGSLAIKGSTSWSRKVCNLIERNIKHSPSKSFQWIYTLNNMCTYRRSTLRSITE